MWKYYASFHFSDSLGTHTLFHSENSFQIMTYQWCQTMKTMKYNAMMHIIILSIPIWFIISPVPLILMAHTNLMEFSKWKITFWPRCFICLYFFSFSFLWGVFMLVDVWLKFISSFFRSKLPFHVSMEKVYGSILICFVGL